MNTRRHRQILWRSLIGLLVLGVLGFAIATQAQNAGKPTMDLTTIQPFQGQLLPLSLADFDLPVLAENQRVDVMIELMDPPTVRVFADAQLGQRPSKARAIGLAKAQLGRVQLAQDQVLKALRNETIDAKVIFSLQRVYNGIAANIDSSQLARILALPGVKGVHPLAKHEPTNSTSVPFLGTPQVWEDLGFDGDGVTIGVIDSGIDYMHTNFGGPGDPATYAANDTTILDGFFPTVKVVGGWDFVGDAYHAGDPANNVPFPDPDPMDCNGHGSHVSGSASGLGVNADGTTFAGPYDGSTPFDDLRIGPGTAPGAELYALRVFGCNGSTLLTSRAIEWAVDPNGDGDFSDHLDVINLSLGSAFGHTNDASAVAVDNAVLAGVFVAAAAGNSGDSYFIMGSPSVAAGALSVAASVDDGLTASRVRVNAPADLAGELSAGVASFGPALDKTGTTGDVAAAIDDDSDGTTSTDGCTALTNPEDIAGKIALIDRGTCNFTVKVKNAQDAGAVAAIIANNAGDTSFPLGGTDNSIVIPSVGIGQGNGDLIRASLDDTVNATLLLITTPERADTMASFSSRGPSRATDGQFHLKPDISAPGLSIISTLTGDSVNGGTSPTTISGTSMATPHVAGIMALLRQAHPDWTVEELKALAMNTAVHDIFLGNDQTPPVWGLGRMGAGRVDAPWASTAQAVAYNADGSGRVSVNFATTTVAGTVSEEQTIRVANKGTEDVTFDLAYESVSDIPGVEITMDVAQITVPAGETRDFAVHMDADSSQMLHFPDFALSLTQNGFPRHWLSEEGGRVILTSDDGDLRVPIYATPRPAATTRSLRRFLDPRHQALLLRGEGVDTTGLAPLPFGELSLLSAVELQHVSVDDPGTAGFTNGADLAYVGVTTDYRSVATLGGGIEDSQIYFAVTTHGNFSTPSENTFLVYIDTNRDGISDYLLFNGNFGSAIGGSSDDVFITLLSDFNTGSLFLADFINGTSAQLNTVPYDTNVMVLPTPAALIGLSEENATFDYYVLSTSRETGVADVTPVMTFNAAQPGIDFSDAVNRSGSCPCPGAPIWVSEGGVGIPMLPDFGALQANHSLGALIVQHHGTDPASRAQAIILGQRLVRDEPAAGLSDFRNVGFTYFFIDLPNGTNGGPLVVSTSGGAGEVDLYVRYGLPPSLDGYDHRSDNLGNAESVTLDSAKAGRVYIGLLSKGGYAGVTLSSEFAP